VIYHLLYPLTYKFSVFNIFKYITFRSVYALITSLIITLLIGDRMIQWLKRIKFGQYIQEDVYTHKKKQGTPTMGGLIIILSVLGSVFLWGDLTNPYLLLCTGVFLGFGLIGFLDDYLKIKRKNNKGLSVKLKFLLQMLVASIFVFILVYLPCYSTKLYVPFFKQIHPDLGSLYILFAMLVIVGSSNGVNLTDGLDGLAIGICVICFACLAIFVYAAGHVYIAKYLHIAYIPKVGETAIFCGSLVGAGLGFLWYNAYPAQIFMGDVGSLSLGAVMGFISILCKQELVLLILGGLFVFETVSVILQVGYFKITGGKRIFRMAPLHHHFELKGVPESKIVIRFWILAILLGMLGLSTLKIR